MRPLYVMATAFALATVAAIQGARGGVLQQPEPPLFSARAELVVLHVVVRDRDGTYVSDLSADAFTVLEDGAPRRIQFFGAQDTPVTIGLIIDSSGSMFAAREQVATAVAAFVDASNPQDEVFALVFNERVRAALSSSAPFTNDGVTLRAALAGAFSPWGRTALHDAILAGLEYLEGGHHQRKVLVVVSDGGDNVSTATFDDVLRQTRASNAAIYTIAFVDPVQRETNPKRLRQIAAMTGGEAFQPKRTAEVGGVLDHVARAIRHAYTIGFEPADPARDGRVRRIDVRVKAPGRRVDVRTRQGYSLEEH